jgi:hypothetical protein
MLPDVKLAFKIVNNYFACDEPSAVTDAWEILKSAVLAQQANNNPIDAICHWEWVDDGYWHSTCGEDWCFIEGTPEENGVVFCHGCGKRVSI